MIDNFERETGAELRTASSRNDDYLVLLAPSLLPIGTVATGGSQQICRYQQSNVKMQQFLYILMPALSMYVMRALACSAIDQPVR